MGAEKPRREFVGRRSRREQPDVESPDQRLGLPRVLPALGHGGAGRFWQLTAPAGAPPAPAPGPGGFGPSVPATMAESSLPQAPRRITLPPSSLSVYEFAVK